MRLITTLTVGALLLGLVHVSLADEGHADHEGAAAGSAHDQLRIAAQGICPISGEKLGEHGAPLKVVVGEHKEEIFLCCEACLQKKIDHKHWATIHANIARAQAKCPVMQKPLPKNPKWTIVNGQIVYVCCPPCTDKIAKDPEPFLERIDGYYTASLQPRAAVR